ncbi:MAG: ATP phosphoribosyltransferase regulatory subunit [Firmicutes bacterium]|nr:ATP phosphoribosyltransferase regulatory subunit [Bacillota bacterium]
MKKFSLPFGLQDWQVPECYQKNALELSLSGVFEGAGFSRVETAALDYYDSYARVVAPERQKGMFKLTDSDGSLLVLRPDVTLQIARMTASKPASDLSKLYYIENSYEFLQDMQDPAARTREFAQVGIEILGKSGSSGDVEAVLMAAKALKESGLEDFLIDIGHIGFYLGALGDCSLAEPEISELKRCINRKDAAAAELLLTGKGLAPKILKALTALNSLYGGTEVLDRAEALAFNPTMRGAVSRLREVVSALKMSGYEQYISVDLGLLKDGYYSGLVMRGLAKGVGAPVLDGGRYDGLCEAFGAKREAVGFAIGIKRLLSALPIQKMPPCDYAFINTEGFSRAEFDRVAELRGRGLRVIKLFGLDKAALVAYCKKHGIKSALVFGTGAEVEEITVKSE